MNIIEKLALNRTVETIIANITKNKDDDTLKDLAQMIYLDLLQKPYAKIEELDRNNQLNFFITRMVLNSINSKTSRYYYEIKRYNAITEEIGNEQKEEE